MYKSIHCAKERKPNIGQLKYWRDFDQNSLAFEYDYQYMIDEIINQIKITCDEAEVEVPHILQNLVHLL
jgi:arginine decarboxylase